MADLSLHQEQEAALATVMRSLWEQAHGTPAHKVHVQVGSDSVVVWIDDALSQAERAAAQRAEGQVLIQRYTEQLLATVRPDLQAQVEAITGRRIVYDSVRPDVDTGYVLCFFVLGERLEPTPAPGNRNTP